LITSQYRAGETIPAFDARLSDALDGFVAEDEAEGGEMKFAIENFEGKVYRSLSTLGHGAYMHVTNTLLRLGLEDSLVETMDGRDGFDCWFATTPETVGALPTDAASEILRAIDILNALPGTERQAIAQSRVGQGVFRKAVVAHWKACAVTGADCIALLRAVHIKPWREASDAERLDPFNGLLLTPNLAAAFEAGFISFDAQGRVLLSKAITGQAAFQLHINAKLRLNTKLLDARHLQRLEHHRAAVFADA
jgi:hypothetical protein